MAPDSWLSVMNPGSSPPGGPIRENNEYDGEYYDARMELSGWDNAGFDDSGWMDVELVEPSSPEISSQMIEPMRITETLKPLAHVQS